MPRYRATHHCRSCRYYFKMCISGRAYCIRAGRLGRHIPYDAARTSPLWCPLGHNIDMIPYPTFEAGPDPIVPPAELPDSMTGNERGYTDNAGITDQERNTRST